MKLVNIKSALAALLLITAVTSCDMDDFGDINLTPNNPSTAPTSMLFTEAAMYVRNFTWGGSTTYDPWMAEWSGYIAEGKNNQFGGMTTTVTFSSDSYYLYPIKNLNMIISLNEDESTKDESYVASFGSNANQIAAAKTLRAFFYMSLTDILGPIVCSEAVMGDEGTFYPVYDSQESVYAFIDSDLRQAYGQFETSGSLDGSYDIFFGGDISKWKKFNATVRMMAAIKLSDVAPSDGQSRFAQAYNDGGMESNSDSFNYTFDSKTAYSWMYYTGNLGYSGRGLNYGPNAIFVNALKEHNDPRVFTYLTIGNDSYYGVRAGDPNDINSYFGITFGLESNAAVDAEKNLAAAVASKYCEMDATYGIITAARAKLVEAEAATLGWISADANTLYQQGIALSFEEQGAEGLDGYLAQDIVKLSSDKQSALEQIVMQRFLAGFLTDGIEAWSDWRRYDVPEMPVTAYQISEGRNSYPYRMGYGDNEKSYNTANVQDAINKAFGGADNIFSRVWWDVKDNKQY